MEKLQFYTKLNSENIKEVRHSGTGAQIFHIWKPPQNSTRQLRFMKRVSYWESKSIFSYNKNSFTQD